MNKKSKTYKRSYKRSYTKHRLPKKQHNIVSLPGSTGVPIFSNTDTRQSNQSHIIAEHKQSGNIITGLRNYYRKKGLPI